jgi:hypothetical protein
MFNDLPDSKFLDVVKDGAESIIIAERKTYIPIYETVYTICKEEKHLISDLTPDQKTYNDPIHIYTTFPFKTANTIADEIYKKHGKWVKLRTIIFREELLVEFDSRRIAKISIIKQHKDVNLQSLIVPIEINELLYMPPELEIINIYRKLYTPIPDDWDDAKKTEARLYEQVITRNVYGGAKCHKCPPIIVAEIKQQLLSEFIPGRNVVLIGEYAMNVKPDRGAKLQIISPDSLFDIADATEFLSHRFSHKVTFKQQELFLPNDFRIRRYVISMQFTTPTGAVKKPIMDIFNSAEFELIPYTGKDGLKIGNSYVLLRFLMIELWIIQIVDALGSLPKTVIKDKVRRFTHLIKLIRGRLGSVFGKEYIGAYKDERVAKKIMMLNKQMYPRYPALSSVR